MSSAVGDLGCSVDNVDFVTVIYTTGYQPSGGKGGGTVKSSLHFLYCVLEMLQIRNVNTSYEQQILRKP